VLAPLPVEEELRQEHVQTHPHLVVERLALVHLLELATPNHVVVTAILIVMITILALLTHVILPLGCVVILMFLLMVVGRPGVLAPLPVEEELRQEHVQTHPHLVVERLALVHLLELATPNHAVHQITVT